MGCFGTYLAQEVTIAMTPMLLALLFLIAALVLIVRATRAGHGRLLFWLLWTCFGLSPVFLAPNDLRWLGTLAAWIYAIGVVGLPVWYLAHPCRPRERGAP